MLNVLEHFVFYDLQTNSLSSRLNIAYSNLYRSLGYGGVRGDESVQCLTQASRSGGLDGAKCRI